LIGQHGTSLFFSLSIHSAFDPGIKNNWSSYNATRRHRQVIQSVVLKLVKTAESDVVSRPPDTHLISFL
jgi:hypothetical protein